MLSSISYFPLLYLATSLGIGGYLCRAQINKRRNKPLLISSDGNEGEVCGEIVIGGVVQEPKPQEESNLVIKPKPRKISHIGGIQNEKPIGESKLNLSQNGAEQYSAQTSINSQHSNQQGQHQPFLVQQPYLIPTGYNISQGPYPGSPLVYNSQYYPMQGSYPPYQQPVPNHYQQQQQQFYPTPYEAQQVYPVQISYANQQLPYPIPTNYSTQQQPLMLQNGYEQQMHAYPAQQQAHSTQSSQIVQQPAYPLHVCYTQDKLFPYEVQLQPFANQHPVTVPFSDHQPNTL